MGKNFNYSERDLTHPSSEHSAIANVDSIKDVLRGDEVVIRAQKIYLRFDLGGPLTKPVIFKYYADTPTGFTRGRLALFVSLGYQRIYAEDKLFKLHNLTIPIEDLQLDSVSPIDENCFAVILR